MAISQGGGTLWAFWGRRDTDNVSSMTCTIVRQNSGDNNSIRAATRTSYYPRQTVYDHTCVFSREHFCCFANLTLPFSTAAVGFFFRSVKEM